MKTYTIQLKDNLAEFYEGISNLTNKTIEEIIQDTLLKVADVITEKTV